jgi:hypothetical protein
VQNSQSSDPTITKLLEIDSDLAAQEAELTLQLQSIQEKRHSLKTVINLFVPDAVAHQTVLTPVVEDIAALQDVTTPELEEGATGTIEATTLPQKQQQKKNLSTSSDKPSKKPSPTKEANKQANEWQQYLRDEFNDASLSLAVSEVMQQQQEQVLDIAAILDAIFVDEIPKAIRSTARERVSNVLSVGAKQGRWYRGQLGKYSMSKVAIENESAV